MLLGLALIAGPLLVAVVDAGFQIRNLSATSQQLVLEGVQSARLSRSLIEAAAAGVPIITTDTPGCRDAVLSGASGFLCPANAPEELAAAMVKLLSRPELVRAMGAAGRRLALSASTKRTSWRRRSAFTRQRSPRHRPGSAAGSARRPGRRRSPPPAAAAAPGRAVPIGSRQARH